ncbi:MAG TPA: phospholipase D-like domain-containing protein [Chitinophagaceae bacterium]|jgi:phosphatidylserine/phosphatidylglycerophosphate/cardiolipin synthase-like enzyme|nr:phospholipase D-like domain-containing protein [Chitinophagaceae bacterium]
MAHRSILVFPDDGAKMIIDSILEAKKSLRIKMFVFSDPELIYAVIDAHKRGLDVKVMLNPARRSGEEENESTRRLFEQAGVNVKDTNPFFGLTHEKSMVVDDRLAFIKSLNWETKNLTETRDYAIITANPHEVEEVIMCFEADWERTDFNPGESARLIWCSINGRDRIARFIDDARHSLFIQNERYQDLVIIERIIRAATRGVKVHVMVRPPHTLKKEKLIEGVGGLRIMDDVGIKIHKLKHLKLHGKMLLADGCRAIVGSINLTPGSFDDRRELAIEVNDAEIVDRLHEIAQYDWENSHKLDLTDAGLFEDLEFRGEGGSEKFILDPENHSKNINHDHDHDHDHKHNHDHDDEHKHKQNHDHDDEHKHKHNHDHDHKHNHNHNKD